MGVLRNTTQLNAMQNRENGIYPDHWHQVPGLLSGTGLSRGGRVQEDEQHARLHLSGISLSECLIEALLDNKNCVLCFLFCVLFNCTAGMSVRTRRQSSSSYLQWVTVLLAPVETTPSLNC